jgi:hypothetical protein
VPVTVHFITEGQIGTLGTGTVLAVLVRCIVSQGTGAYPDPYASVRYGIHLSCWISILIQVLKLHFRFKERDN